MTSLASLAPYFIAIFARSDGKRLTLLNPLLSFFLKIWSGIKILWEIVKRFTTPRPSINIQQAEHVTVVAPVITGQSINDITIRVEPAGWPKKLEKLASVAPTLLEMPETPSIDRQATLVYKNVMRGLRRATTVLDPIISQALYLYCTRKAALLAGNQELARLVEAKLEKVANLPSRHGYTPPDIKKWYARFSDLDDAGDLSGIVIPCLEKLCQRMLSELGLISEAHEDCANLIKWAHTRLSERKPSFFKSQYLNIGTVFIGEQPVAGYIDHALRLLKDKKSETLIFAAYGTGYTFKSAQAASFIHSLKTQGTQLAEIILTPQFKFKEAGEAPPFLASYFILHANFLEKAEVLKRRWETLAKAIIKSAVDVKDEETALSIIAQRLKTGKRVLVRHGWQTWRQFFKVCFRAILYHRARIACHSIEIRRDGGPTGDKPSTYVSLILELRRA